MNIPTTDPQPDWVDPWPESYAAKQMAMPVIDMTPPKGLRIDKEPMVPDLDLSAL